MSVSTVTDREIHIPAGHKIRKGSVKLANALLLELLNYGIVPEEALLRRIHTLPKQKAAEVCREILKMYTIGDVNPPLFPNWEQRTNFTFSEFVVQILGYIVQLSGNDLEDPEYMNTLKAQVDFSKLKKLKLACDDRAVERFLTLVNSNVALNKQSQSDLLELAKEYYYKAPTYIRSDEARIAVIMGAVDSGMTLFAALRVYNAKPADVLRYSAARNNFEYVKLPSDVKYESLSWQQRRHIMEFLDRFELDDLCEAMGNNRTAWDRFYRHFHIKSFNYNKVVAAVFLSLGSAVDALPKNIDSFLSSKKHRKCYDVTSGGNLVYRTFASRIQSCVDNKDMDSFEQEIASKPGYLFRNLATLSHVCTKATESRFVEFVRSMIDRPKTDVLLSLVQIGVNSKYRIIDSKGNTTVTEADYHPVIAEIQGLAEREIFRRHGFIGKVDVSDSLKNKVVPFLSTNAELDRGTRIKFDDTHYMYFLMHWVQTAKRRTDLDHSYLCIHTDGSVGTVYFGRQANSYIAQSGDITNAPAPQGATEYGRINLKNIPTNVQYIVPLINVYSGDVFSENEVAYAGFFFSDRPEFHLTQDHVRYDLSQPAESNVPFVIDVINKEVIIVDFNNRQRLGWTAHSSIDEVKKIIEAVKTKKTMTIGRFAEILSGDKDTVSLKITNKGKGDNKIAPQDLVELVS